jgi:phage terminase large subunit GpA-like protein
MVTHWPEGITDIDISPDTEAGKLWLEYSELRKKSFRLYEDNRLAKEHYKANRQAMDEGFEVSWETRFNPKTELSAQQRAMDIRLANPLTFLAEYQNKPKATQAGAYTLITASTLAEKVVDVPRHHIPVDCDILTAFIDIQDELFFYTVFSCNRDFNGLFIDYGTWPPVKTRNFRKYQAQGWRLLTQAFFKAYPQVQANAMTNTKGQLEAPFEAKIYFGLQQTVNFVMGQKYTKVDEFQSKMRIQRLGIDVRWGKAASVSKRFCREVGIREVIPYQGFSIPPTRKQFEEYNRVDGWVFEDAVNPSVREVNWVYRPDESGLYRYTVDVDRMKTFLMSRLSSPLGASGSIALFQAEPEEHGLFASHLCDSEYPETLTARGINKDTWLVREQAMDNDFLDCSVGCLVLASHQGASLRSDHEPKEKTPIRKRWSELAAEKQGKGR